MSIYKRNVFLTIWNKKIQDKMTIICLKNIVYISDTVLLLNIGIW